MFVGTSIVALGNAGASARDVGSALAIGGTGLAVTVAAIAGIVLLGRKLGKSQSTAVNVAAVLGIVCLTGFALVGLLATGCGAMLAS
jgi:hypothetical protein